MPIDNAIMQYKKSCILMIFHCVLVMKLYRNQDILLSVINAVQVYATNMFVLLCLYR